MSGDRDYPKQEQIREVFMYPQWLIDLQQEVHKYHSELIQKYDLTTKDYTQVLAFLGLEVNIAIEGNFNFKELEALSREILERLKKRRELKLKTSSGNVALLAPAKSLLSPHSEEPDQDTSHTIHHNSENNPK